MKVENKKTTSTLKLKLTTTKRIRQTINIPNSSSIRSIIMWNQFLSAATNTNNPLKKTIRPINSSWEHRKKDKAEKDKLSAKKLRIILRGKFNLLKLAKW